MSIIDKISVKENGSPVVYDIKDANALRTLNVTSNIENEATASKAYSIGDYLYRNDTLYKVITAIAQDDVFIIDTNIEATDVMNETGNVAIATTSIAGIVKPDGTTISVAQDGTINTNFEDWVPKSWNISPFYGYYIWTDGTNIYDSESSNDTQFVLNQTTGNWDVKTWNGLSNINGNYVWTDGTNIYYSNGTTHKVLDVSTSTWSDTTWTGLTNFYGQHIWTDGEDIYYSTSNNQYILNKSTGEWSAVTWNGYSSIDGVYVWTDGTNVYYSNTSNQYVLEKSTNTWNVKTWNGYSSIKGNYVWKIDNEIYYSDNTIFKILDKSTSTWKDIVWSGLTESFYGVYVQSDGTNTYYSYHDMHYEYVPNLNAFLDNKQNVMLSSPITIGGISQTTVEGALNALSSYLEQTVTLSTSETTAVTFTSSIITTSSLIDIAVSEWGLVPDDVTTTTGVCTVTMPKVDNARSVTVRIYVR